MQSLSGLQVEKIVQKMFKLILILVSVVALECRGSVIKNKDYDLFDE